METEKRITGRHGTVLRVEHPSHTGEAGLRLLLHGDGELICTINSHGDKGTWSLELSPQEVREANRLAHQLPHTSSAPDGVLVTMLAGDEQEPIEKIVKPGAALNQLLDLLHTFYLEAVFYLESGRRARSRGDRERARELMEDGIQRLELTRRPQHLPPIPDYSDMWRRDSLEEERLLTIGSFLDTRIMLYEEQVSVKAGRVVHQEAD